jgi:hypothetical protein
LLKTRADIEYHVKTLACFMANPGQKHWKCALQLLKYLKGNMRWGIKYRRTSGPLRLIGYVDSDYAADQSRRSRTGWVVFLCGAPLSWLSKQQGKVTLSTAEAEWMALADCIRELIPIVGLISELGFLQGRPIVREDNQAAIKMALNEKEVTDRRKHIDVRVNWIREVFSCEWITLTYIRSDFNIADAFTKPLGRVKFPHFRKLLMNRGLGSAR